VKPRTLRSSLTLSYAGTLTLFLVSLGLIYYHAFARQLDADATTELREMTRGVHGYLRFDRGVPQLAYDRGDPDQVAFIGEATRYYQVFDAKTGSLVAQSPALEPLGLHYTPAEVHDFVNDPSVFDIQTDRQKIRFSNGLVTAAPGEAYLVQVGVPLDQRDAALGRFRSLVTWSVPLGLVAVVIVGRWMAARALAPLARLAAAATTIDIDDLHRRLPVRGAGDELDAVADAFNGVVARLERAVSDMKQFSAAMAHELRTPLAAMRGDIELSLAHPALPLEYRRVMTSQLEEIERLSRLISQLLTLAQADAGEIPLAHGPVDVAALSAAVVSALEPVAEEKGLSLVCECSGETIIAGDQGWIQRLLLNLLDNAIKFTPAGGTVTVVVAPAGGSARLTVRDTGIGIPADALPHVFERFYRGDPARSSRVKGVGLGLSLVKWIADRHGASIDVDSQIGQGSTFTVTLPMRSVPSTQRHARSPAQHDRNRGRNEDRRIGSADDADQHGKGKAAEDVTAEDEQGQDCEKRRAGRDYRAPQRLVDGRIDHLLE
jgi:heavy metal sensor kinase